MNSRASPMPALVASVALLASIGGTLHGCAAQQPFQWVDEFPGAREPGVVYRIAPHDVISVRVWNQEAMSLERARVRDDGKISLPFLKDVSASGLTPNELGARLQQALLNFIVEPVVTVTVEETAPLTVSVLGEVTTSGAFTLVRPAGVLQAIAAAGGLNQYADRDAIYVLRRLAITLPPVRIRFRYRELTSGGTVAATFLLNSGDVVVVE